jgi:lysozyme
MRSWRDDLVDQLKRHEGWRSHAYQDHLGWWTIGYGRMIDQRRGGGISEQEGALLLANDVELVVTALHQRIDWFGRLPPRKKQALANMAFQMGIDGLLKFHTTLNHLKNRNWSAARRSALESLWAKQTPTRAQEIAGMLGEEE